MTFLTKRKKAKIAKLIAATWYDASFGIDCRSESYFETIGVIIANLAGIAVEVGGMKMSKAVADLYEELYKKMKTGRNCENCGWLGKDDDCGESPCAYCNHHELWCKKETDNGSN